MIFSSIYRYFILGLIGFVMIFLSLHPLPKLYFGTTADEGYYYRYASSVVHRGWPAFNDLLSWYSSSEQARIHPAPVRVGYILLCALLIKFSSYPSLQLLAFISTFSFFVFLCVCFHYLRKYFDLDTALLTTLFLVSSPLMIGLSRRALVDSSVNLLWGLAIWLFLDVLLKPKRFSYICFLAALFMAITFKEASVILIPFFVLTALIGRRHGAVIKNSQIGGIILWPLVLIILFYGWVYGGLGFFKTVAIAIYKTHFSSGYNSAYAINLCSGPWFKYLLDFLLLIPIELILFIMYVGYLCVGRKTWDFTKTYLMAYFVYVYSVLSCLAHSKVVRYVENLEMVIALFAVLMLLEIFKDLESYKRKFIIFALAFGIFVYNWYSFVNLFYKNSLLDPISFYLLLQRHFIPS